MRIGRWIITREHPQEEALRKWGQLSPELRELIARAARSMAKDAVQDVMDAQGLVYDPASSGCLTGTLNQDGRTARHAATEMIARIIDDDNPKCQRTACDHMWSFHDGAHYRCSFTGCTCQAFTGDDHNVGI